jgi:AcrR family transcriptional regulator
MTAASKSKREPALRRPRGRPPRLSRDRIVDAVLATLEREPEAALTIARIAREVGAVPAALYRHFESLDEILDSVLSRVLGRIESVVVDDVTWQTQLEGWMLALRTHLLRYPAVIPLIGQAGRTSPAWLETSSSVVTILEHAGLTGRALAATYLWVLETTVGLVMQEAALPVSEQIARAKDSSSEMSVAARARFEPILQNLETLSGDDFFSFVAQQTVAAIELSTPPTPHRDRSR